MQFDAITDEQIQVGELLEKLGNRKSAIIVPALFIDLYMPLIDKSSIVDGQFDEDCKQYILLQVALQIMKFKI